MKYSVIGYSINLGAATVCATEIFLLQLFISIIQKPKWPLCCTGLNRPKYVLSAGCFCKMHETQTFILHKKVSLCAGKVLHMFVSLCVHQIPGVWG